MRAAALIFMLLLPALAGAAERQPFAIGYLEIADDPRYAEIIAEMEDERELREEIDREIAQDREASSE